MLKAFKEFALRGNVIDLAVGIIIGSQLNNVVQSLVNDIIMPPFGLILNRVNFRDLYYSLNGKGYPSLADAQAAGAPVIAWGQFLQTVITFLIVAFVVFLLIRMINRMHKEPPKDTNTKQCPYCYETIPLKATRCPECTSTLDA